MASVQSTLLWLAVTFCAVRAGDLPASPKGVCEVRAFLKEEPSAFDVGAYFNMHMQQVATIGQTNSCRFAQLRVACSFCTKHKSKGQVALLLAITRDMWQHSLEIYWAHVLTKALYTELHNYDLLIYVSVLKHPLSPRAGSPLLCCP